MCPSLLDWVSERRSPLTFVLQYLSGILAGRGERLRLLWMKNHFESWADWASNPANAHSLLALRQSVTTLASWLHRRFSPSSSGWPWKLAALCDTRIALVDRRELALEFWDVPDVELGEHFSMRLRASVETPMQLLSPATQSFLWAWSSQVSTSVANVEFKHGRNRARAHRAMSWQSFVAQYVNHESQLERQARLDIVRLGLEQTGRGPNAATLPPPRQRRRRKQTAREIHRYDVYAQWRAIGRKFVVPKTWPEVNAAWDALTPEERTSYFDQAALGEYRAPRQLPALPAGPAAESPTGALALTVPTNAPPRSQRTRRTCL